MKGRRELVPQLSNAHSGVLFYRYVFVDMLMSSRQKGTGTRCQNEFAELSATNAKVDTVQRAGLPLRQKFFHLIVQGQNTQA